MAIGIVRQICIASERRMAMRSVTGALALDGTEKGEGGKGLKGDRYATRKGSYNQPQPGDPDDEVRRQVTVMHESVFDRLGVFDFDATGRNILVGGKFELMWLLSQQLRGRPADFEVGDAIFRPVAYCDPCKVPNMRAQIPLGTASFEKLYAECGGLIVEVIRGGWIEVGSKVKTPDKGY